MSPYIGLQIKPHMSRIWKLDFHLWTEAKDSPQPIRDALARPSGPRLRWALGSSGPVHRCGLKCLNTAFPRPLGRKRANEWLHRFENDRSIRGASQQQQPHKSNSSGRVKPLTPLLARKKRMPSLTSVSRFWFIPGVKLANSHYTKLCHTGCALIITTRLCFSTEALITAS